MRCKCKADLFSKEYPNGFSGRSIFNGFRKSTDIKTDYTCVARDGKTEIVTGTHHVDYFTENDNTLLAWGAEVYTRRTPTLRVEKTVKAHWFDPARSKVPELKEWAKKNSCRMFPSR